MCGQHSSQAQKKFMKQQIKNEQKNGSVKTAQPNVSMPITKPQPKKQDEVKTPSLEERIQRVDELKALTLKRQRTIETLHNVRTFNFASDDNCVLSLVDSQGAKFQTNNSNLISLLKDYFVALLNDKVSTLDDEILAFKL